MSTLKRIIAGLAVCFVALACNQDELQSLQSSTFEMSGVIATINEQVNNINATIEDLKAADTAIDQAISALQAEDEAIRSQLEADKAKVEASIDSLGNYVNDQLLAAQDWARATFATLEQYQHLCDSVAAVKQSLEEMDARITSQLKHDLDSLETSMKAWVNEQLAGYYTIAQMDAKLAALEKTVQDGDQANADAIAQLEADLAKQATDLTAAYEAAITAAITENNGLIDEKIATEITTVNTRITNEVKALGDRIDALDLRIQAVEDYINNQKGFTISFTMPKDTVCFPGETINVEYIISESTLPTQIECIPDDGWKASVTSNGNTGNIAITAPATGGNGKIIVLANRSSWTLMSTLSFDEGVLHVAQNEYPAPAESSILSIPFSINANYGIKVAEADKSWLHYNNTKAAMRDETLTLTVDANPNQSIRVGKVYIYPEDGNNDEYYELKINQASAFFSVSTTGFVIGGDVASKEVTVTSSLPFNLDVPAEADWLSATSEFFEGTTYKITISFTANNGENRRTADLGFISTDGSTRYGSVAIIQDTRSEEDISAMVFEVRASYANNFTVYLPIGYTSYINSEGMYIKERIDCFINWGDGSVEHLDHGVAYAEHNYGGIDAPTNYEVTVSGMVPVLSSTSIPDSKRYGIVAVKQWGRTGLKSLNEAFDGVTSLTSISNDDVRSFENVNEMTRAFSRTSIVDIPIGLFDYCKNVFTFQYVFLQTPIETAPNRLFAHCVKARNYWGAFYGCNQLKTVGADLFADNGEALYFQYLFEGCYLLSSIPESIFDGCVAARSFEAAFRGCNLLTNIPASLFSSCTEVESFQDTFSGCYGLITVPSSLFDNNRKVLSFASMFSGVGGIIDCETPFTMINGEKVHLYERVNYPDYFIAPAQTNSCFTQAWSDWDDIPLSWRY